jgi:hypothetical protein
MKKLYFVALLMPYLIFACEDCIRQINDLSNESYHNYKDQKGNLSRCYYYGRMQGFLEAIQICRENHYFCETDYELDY